MRPLLLIGFSLFLGLGACGQKVVTLKMSGYYPYCGGARPTQQMEEEASRARPLRSMKFVLVGEGRVDSAITSGKGQLKFRLPPGTYKLYEAWRYHRTGPDGAGTEAYDPECLKEQWARESRLIEVKPGGSISVKIVNDVIVHCSHAQPCARGEQAPPPGRR